MVSPADFVKIINIFSDHSDEKKQLLIIETVACAQKP